jgi:hypothetical protein
VALLAVRGGEGRGRPSGSRDVLNEDGEVLRRWRNGKWWRRSRVLGALTLRGAACCGNSTKRMKRPRGFLPMTKVGGGGAKLVERQQRAAAKL